MAARRAAVVCGRPTACPSPAKPPFNRPPEAALPKGPERKPAECIFRPKVQSTRQCLMEAVERLQGAMDTPFQPRGRGGRFFAPNIVYKDEAVGHVLSGMVRGPSQVVTLGGYNVVKSINNAPFSQDELQRQVKLMVFSEDVRQELKTRHLIGVDESGGGEIAGPVVSVALIMPKRWLVQRCRDSKLLDENAVHAVAQAVLSTPQIITGVGVLWPKEMEAIFDTDNCLRSVRRLSNIRAVRNLVNALDQGCDSIGVLLDGVGTSSSKGPDGPLFCGLPVKEVAGADALALPVAAASCVARSIRIKLMAEIHKRYPMYHFDLHRGNLTDEHLKAIMTHGPIEGVHVRYKLLDENFSKAIAGKGKAAVPKNTRHIPSASKSPVCSLGDSRDGKQGLPATSSPPHHRPPAVSNAVKDPYHAKASAAILSIKDSWLEILEPFKLEKSTSSSPFKKSVQEIVKEVADLGRKRSGKPHKA